MISSALTKKDRIIVSALKLFSEHGYQDTKIINIAKDAKVGKGTIYEYFEDKKQLFDEAVEITMASSYEYLHQDLDFVDNYTACLKDNIMKEIDIVEENITLFKLFLQITNNPILYNDFKISRILLDLQSKRFVVFKQIVEKGVQAKEFGPVNPELAALSILSSLNAYIIFKYKLHPNFGNMPKIESATIDELLVVIINGIK